jgi:hypothetical protein
MSALLSSGSDFYHKVLSDFHDWSYYVALNVSSPGYKGPVVVQNVDLFLLTLKSRKLTESEYTAKMERLLAEDIPLKVDDSDFQKSGLLKVTLDDSVAQYAKQGIEVLTKRYFREGVRCYIMRDEVTDEEKASIIYQLFKRQIACHVDDETGYLIFFRQQ